VGVSFLNPLGALVGFAVLLPLGALVLRERRAAVARSVLGLRAPRRRVFLPAVACWIVAFGLLAAASAQPVLRVDSTVERRADAEAFVVVDTTRSMLAAPDPGARNRIQRALDTAIEIRDALPGIPVGVGSLTNRPLPHLFPTTDGRSFARVVRQAIGVNRPPGSVTGLYGAGTDFESLETIAGANWFRPGSVKRLVILLTDGESSPFAPPRIVSRLARSGVDLVVVRFWSPADRVWRADGSVEPYRPEPESLRRLNELGALTTGGRVFRENDLNGVVGAARRYLGDGPAVRMAAGGRTVSLAPFAVLAACLPLALLLLPGLLPRRAQLRPRTGAKNRRERIAYSMVSAWRGSSTTPQRR